ncbi:MAG TPA: putative toxin-antitoxin system toxin component, PIN family [Burkholderiales bacterium]|nr:putative toxin-antitoxin system toxin component, PIN family [Burkholderiales bacterium]
MRIVLDTNVLVSGLMYPKSIPGIAVAAWREGRFDLVMPLAQLEEIGRVLAYPKIRRILRWEDGKIGEFLKHLYLRAEIVEPAKLRAGVRDPDDLHVLAALAHGMADILVTGDEDLLAPREQYAIETPAQFVRRL